MQAMMLTAGLGERMLPLTRTLPKPAIPVLGRPIAVQALRWMAAGGVTDAALNLHHLSDVVRGLLGDGSEHGLPRLRYSYEEQILGTGGGLRKAAELLDGDDPVLVCNADILTDIDLPGLWQAHRRSGLQATLVLVPHRSPYSTIEVDGEGRVLSLAGAPDVDPARVAGRFLFTGCHVIERSAIERIPADRPSCVVRDLYRSLAGEGGLGSVFHEGFWWEFGSPESYLEGSLKLIELSGAHDRRVTEHDPVREVDQSLVALGAGAELQPSARVKGRAAIGFAACLASGSCVEDTIVMPEAWIAPACRLRRAIVAPAVELPQGFEAENALICSDSIPEGELGPRITRVDGLLVHRLANTGG
jgi:NDP-sugar pyrophosphorylase family protein